MTITTKNWFFLCILTISYNAKAGEKHFTFNKATQRIETQCNVLLSTLENKLDTIFNADKEQRKNTSRRQFYIDSTSKHLAACIQLEKLRVSSWKLLFPQYSALRQVWVSEYTTFNYMLSLILKDFEKDQKDVKDIINHLRELFRHQNTVDRMCFATWVGSSQTLTKNFLKDDLIALKRLRDR